MHVYLESEWGRYFFIGIFTEHYESSPTVYIVVDFRYKLLSLSMT